MFNVSIKPIWDIHNRSENANPSDQRLPTRVIEVLTKIDQLGSVAAASQELGMSYRHTWDLIRQGDLVFGQPLVVLQRGKGSTLTPLGEKLVWADRRISARLSPVLDSLASELAADLEQLFGTKPDLLRIEAPHGFAVQALHSLLSVQQVANEIKYCASEQALSALKNEHCELAGFHIPVGEFQTACVKHFSKWFDRKQHRVIEVASRRQGLIVANKNPKKIYGLNDLARKQIRFINRQPSSGTRFLLDLMLKKQGIDPAKINGYEQCELTHAAVAACVASNMADAAYGIETPARQFNLEFVPIQTERYFFLCHQRTLAQSNVQQLINTLNADAYRNAVDGLPGYNAADAGRVMTLAQAFGS